MAHHPSTVTLLQASQNNAVLARLMDINRASNARLAAIQSLIPSALRTGIKAGSLDDEGWTLLLANSTTAAKMRQLIPALEAHLRVQGLEVKAIRLKVVRGA